MKDLTVKEVAALRVTGKYRVSRNLYLQLAEGGARSGCFATCATARHIGTASARCDLVSLAEARDKVIACRKLLLAGIDPIEHERAKRVEALLAAASTMTFRNAAKRTSLPMNPDGATPKHRQQWRNTLRPTSIR